MEIELKGELVVSLKLGTTRKTNTPKPKVKGTNKNGCWGQDLFKSLRLVLWYKVVAEHAVTIIYTLILHLVKNQLRLTTTFAL